VPQVSELLRPVPYAVLDAQRLAVECAEDAVAVGALSRLLRVVSGAGGCCAARPPWRGTPAP
jgi:hypothetical protein